MASRRTGWDAISALTKSATDAAIAAARSVAAVRRDEKRRSNPNPTSCGDCHAAGTVSPAMSWCTVESDPGVFTSLIEAFGARGLQIQELYTLDAATIPKPVHGIFFLFKWDRAKGKPVTTVTPAESASDIVFLPQTISNACGTLALLHVLLNAPGLDEDLGGTLRDFRSFVAPLPPALRGQALDQCDAIRIAHNSFARPEPFEAEEREADEDDEAYHFVAYTRVGSRVVELDGLKEGPVELGRLAAGDDDWLAVVVPELERRIAEYGASEIHFNLLALVGDRRISLAKELWPAVLQVRAAEAGGAATGGEKGVPADVALLRGAGLADADITLAETLAVDGGESAATAAAAAAAGGAGTASASAATLVSLEAARERVRELASEFAG